MTDEHKAALAEGRSQGRAVRRYLEALETHRPKRGRKRTPDSIKKRLERINGDLSSAEPLQRLLLIQEQLDLQNELNRTESNVDLTELENEFVAAAKPYSDRKGISYAAWRSYGIPPAVLKRAGIGRGAS
jgi:uncharacterized protein YicC (UPF0701 family)